MPTVISYLIANNSNSQINVRGVSGDLILNPGEEKEFNDPDASWLLKTYGFLSGRKIEKEITHKEDHKDVGKSSKVTEPDKFEKEENGDEEKLDEGNEEEKEEVKEEVDYNKYTKVEIMKLLDEKGLKYKTNAKKASLIRTLKKSK